MALSTPQCPMTKAFSWLQAPSTQLFTYFPFLDFSLLPH